MYILYTLLRKKFFFLFFELLNFDIVIKVIISLKLQLFKKLTRIEFRFMKIQKLSNHIIIYVNFFRIREVFFMHIKIKL